MKGQFLGFLLLTLFACTTTSKTPTNPDASLQDRFDTLASAFRTLPNVAVDGQSAYYRGNTSLTAETELQVVAEGRVVGTLADASSLYPLNEIVRLRLIRPLDAASRYGNIASNGAVELILKK